MFFLKFYDSGRNQADQIREGFLQSMTACFDGVAEGEDESVFAVVSESSVLVLDLLCDDLESFEFLGGFRTNGKE